MHAHTHEHMHACTHTHTTPHHTTPHHTTPHTHTHTHKQILAAFLQKASSCSAVFVIQSQQQAGCYIGRVWMCLCGVKEKCFKIIAGTFWPICSMAGNMYGGRDKNWWLVSNQILTCKPDGIFWTLVDILIAVKLLFLIIIVFCYCCMTGSSWRVATCIENVLLLFDCLLSVYKCFHCY